MHRFEIFVAQNPVERAFEPAPPASEPSSGLRRSRRRAREVLDIFLSGANVTARVQEAEVSSVLRDIGRAVVMLAKQPENKAIVRFYDEPWELTIERFGKVAALSVYRAGSEPVVAAYDQEVSFAELCEGVLDAVSTSATMSPRCTRSPGATSHSTTVPRSMSAPSEGMVKTPIR